MELCNGNGIGKIMSGVGKPLLMDNMTKQRCLKKSGKLDFARVLVEVSADDDLPSSLEISYPPIGNRPAKVGVLDVKYQWKPPLCTHCKKNWPASSLMNLGQVRGGGQSNRGGRVQMNSRQGYSNEQRRNGGFVQRSQYQQRGNSNVGNANKNGKSGVMNRSISKLSVNDPFKGSLVDKPALASTYTQNFRPGVLVRGSGSANADTSSFREDVPVKNSFQVLDDQMMKDKEECVLESMDEEYKSDIWLKLKQDVIDVMESGCYPSATIHDDVATEDGGMASDMRDDDVELVARSIDNGGLLRLRTYPTFKAFSWNVRGLNNDPNRKQKSWGSNSGNTEDGGKTVGGAIGAVAEDQERCFPVKLGNSLVKPGILIMMKALDEIRYVNRMSVAENKVVNQVFELDIGIYCAAYYLVISVSRLRQIGLFNTRMMLTVFSEGNGLTMDLPSSSYSKFNSPMAPHVLSFVYFILFNGASWTTITVVSDCGFTGWPGILVGSVLNVSGFELENGNLFAVSLGDYYSCSDVRRGYPGAFGFGVLHFGHGLVTVRAVRGFVREMLVAETLDPVESLCSNDPRNNPVSVGLISRIIYRMMIELLNSDVVIMATVDVACLRYATCIMDISLRCKMHHICGVFCCKAGDFLLAAMSCERPS
ncbi:RNA-directed DNA polymerase, eukaryota, reverse transcriptase zinc-binding domain protein [Tanacetum coccineum]